MEHQKMVPDHSDHLAKALELAFKDDSMESADVVFEFKSSEQKIEVDDSKCALFFTSTFLLRISKEAMTRQSCDVDETQLDIRDTSTVFSNPLSGSIPRTPLTLPERDQLRSMIVLLNESNRVLLKIRQRFPLSASTRCDVIQCQIQMQLQELFGEFRSNDEDKFKEMLPRNRETFLTIWNHLAQLIVESCYQLP